MKRRDALKRLGTAGGSLMLGLSGQELAGATNALTAKPLRGLIARNGQSWQPIVISASEKITESSVIKVDGVACARESISVSSEGVEILVPAVKTARQATVTLETTGVVSSASVTLDPVRHVLVYVLPHSHHDLGYTTQQAEVEQKQLANIDRGIKLAQKTQTYREGARFVWNLEVLWGAQLYLRNASPERRAGFIDAVKKGHLALNGMYANELTGLCRPEELVQLFRYGTKLGAECGVKVDSAMLSDVPGFTWGTATAMAQAGIRYVSAAPNWFDRIGTLMVEWQDKPFWWVSPSGKERVLLWIPWTGYAMSHVVKKMSPEWVGDYQKRLDDVRFPYDLSYIRWSGHGDNAEPDPDISEFINEWGAKYEWPKFRISSTSEAFSAFEAKYGNGLPEHRGDLTPYWEDGAGSSAHETALSRGAAEKIVQAEALFAMRNGKRFKAEAAAEAWRDVLLYSEHTWGAWNSVSDSENKFVTDQWKVKQEFSIDADRRAHELLAEALPMNDRVHASKIAIWNTTSWTRSEPVTIPKELSAGRDLVRDQHGKTLPSQRLVNGDLAVAVKDVPPFAAITLNLSEGKSSAPTTPVTAHEDVLENGRLRVRVHPTTGNIVELYAHGVEGNLADDSDGGLNQYLYLEGSNVADLQKSGSATVTVEENGPLIASLRIESSAPGCNRLIRTVKLAAGADSLEIVNLVDKKKAALNPNGGKGGPGDAFAQRGNKESVQFSFPLAVTDGQMRVDVPLAVMRPEIDQLPGSCKNWLPVGRWIDVSNPDHGVTWVSLDAPLVEIGEVSANLLGSQRDPALWRKHITPTQRFYSWVMNNHWGTNYRAYQEGPVTFRYALWPHKRFDAAATARLATGMSQPLLASAGVAKNGMEPVLTVEPPDVLVTAFKPSDDGRGYIVRLFGASGEDREVKLKWPTSPRITLWKSDTSEQKREPLQENFSVGAWQLLTVRAERADA